MDRKHIAKKTAEVIISYLTYQAMRTVREQLREVHPVKAVWLGQFSSQGKLQDGEAYLEELVAEDREIALRIMTVRQHLADEIVEFLPEMVSLGIQQANMDRRRRLLERMTQVQPVDEVAHEEERVPAQPEPELQSGLETSSPADGPTDPTSPEADGD
ncbi:chaperonin family protein RbcX [Synechococcus sp. PCC 7336]|uniref:chaperonin family protein RbcX n=1 Tax=Synechococcus sp. PCC 7336 TaxID=195250 RepID=UPI00034689CD|nr:chaperonin family protein RbcX [Synechococcus sp. PCC 7336]